MEMTIDQRSPHEHEIKSEQIILRVAFSLVQISNASFSKNMIHVLVYYWAISNILSISQNKNA